MNALRTATALLGALAACSAAAAQFEPVPLNDHQRLGQRFRADKPWVGLWVSVPSWSDNEGGLTLTAWDSPDRKRRLGARTLTGIRDNERVEIRLNRAAPAGSYYWEVDARTGQTRIGLYTERITGDATLCAYLDGVPDPRRRFVSGLVPAALGHLQGDAARLTAVLQSGASLQEKLDACRLLAVLGGPGSVPTLAGLLTDRKLSHMARFALEPVPGAAASQAFRKALGRTRGALQVGVINSIAERGDPLAVGPLRQLLGSKDGTVADAAAAALGRIGTPTAGTALRARLAGTARAAVYEGALRCAGALRAAGKTADARRLYDALRASRAPRHVLASALRGAALCRGQANAATVLVPALRAPDIADARAALYVVQRELPGAGLTRALVQALPSLTPARRALLVDAIAHRRDASAASAVVAAAGQGPLEVRLAAVRALPAVGYRAAVPALVPLLADPDARVAAAARETLTAMPPSHAASWAGNLMGSSDEPSVRRGIDLVVSMQMAGFAPQVLALARSPHRGVRLEALKALQRMGGAEQLPGLLDALAAAGDADEQGAAEQAAAAVAGRLPDRDVAAAAVAGRMTGAGKQTQVALVRILAGIGGPQALEAVHRATMSEHGDVHAAAEQALLDWRTADAAPYLLNRAMLSSIPNQVARFMRGVLRLAGDTETPADVRLDLCTRAAQMTQLREEEKRMLLGALGGIGTGPALNLAAPYLDDAGVRDEAAAAVVAIADKLAGTPAAAQARPALEKVAAGEGPLAARARALLGR